LIHPRMNLNSTKKMLEIFPKKNMGKIITPKITPVEILYSYPTVCGMSSTLLYEAWICGMKIFSIQPNLKMPWLDFYQELEGIFYTEKNFNTETLSVLEDFSKSKRSPNPRHEVIHRHKNVVKNILNL